MSEQSLNFLPIVLTLKHKMWAMGSNWCKVNIAAYKKDIIQFWDCLLKKTQILISFL